ncbi:glycosyltransferase family 4 protein [Haloarcula regularis]|nr:glycosyltransferase family 4 protein [Halomicroarcula sp. SYNS111]
MEEYNKEAILVKNIHNSPDISSVTEHEEREYILWVGRVERSQKKPHRFLNLASKLPEKEFILIGPKTENDQYYSEIMEWSSQLENVSFLGYVPPQEIMEYYNQAQMLVNTSDFEGFPNTFLEAWGYCCPVISLHYEADGIIEQEAVGKVSGSISAMVNDVREISERPKLRNKLGRRAREYVEEHHSQERIINDIERIILNHTGN